MHRANLIAALVLAGMTQERADELAPKVIDHLEPIDNTEVKTDAAEELATALGEKRAEAIRADAAEAQVAELTAKLDAVDEAAIAQRYLTDRAPLEDAAKHLELKLDADANNMQIREAIAADVGVDVEHVDAVVKALGKRPLIKRDARLDGIDLKTATVKADADPFTLNERIDRGELMTHAQEV